MSEHAIQRFTARVIFLRTFVGRLQGIQRVAERVTFRQLPRRDARQIIDVEAY